MGWDALVAVLIVVAAEGERRMCVDGYHESGSSRALISMLKLFLRIAAMHVVCQQNADKIKQHHLRRE